MIKNFMSVKNILKTIIPKSYAKINTQKGNAIYWLGTKGVTLHIHTIQTNAIRNRNKENKENENLKNENLKNGESVTSCYNDIVVHEKYKLQISLCIDRFPLNFIQEPFEKDFENFKDEWLLKTKNNLEISEDFLRMKYNLSSFNEKEKISKTNIAEEEENIIVSELNSFVESEEGGNIQKVNGIKENREIERENQVEVEDELEELFSLEGINKSLRKKKEKETIDGKEKEKVQIYDNKRDYKNIKRKPNDFLYLLVKYKKYKKWMFPLIDYSKSFTIRQVLQQLCKEQMKWELPIFIGYCPCTYEKRKFSKPIIENEILGRKIFYYRAHYTNIEKNLDISNNELIIDFAWLTRTELPSFLSRRKFLVIRDALPLT